MTAFSRRVLGSTLAAFVSMPAVATAVGFGPMSYHSGAALLVRVLAVLAASGALAMVFAIAGYLYWLHVIVPAPAPAAVRPLTHDNRGLTTQTA